MVPFYFPIFVVFRSFEGLNFAISYSEVIFYNPQIELINRTTIGLFWKYVLFLLKAGILIGKMVRSEKMWGTRHKQLDFLKQHMLIYFGAKFDFFSMFVTDFRMAKKQI